MDQSIPQYQLLLAYSSALMVAVSFYYMRQPTNKLPLPPSPKSDPIIGHLRYMPTSSENDLYTRWGKELNSDIISLNVLGDTIIILSSAKAAYELLDQRSAIYSDRPKLPVASYPDLNNWTNNTAFLPYGERWRSQRRMTHASMHKKASMQFWPTIMKQTRLGLQRLVEDPENLFKELRRMSGTTLLSVVYGYEVTGANDPLVQVVETAIRHLSECMVPGNFLVNAFPWLRYCPNWFPGTEWKRTVKQWSMEKDQMVDIPFEWTKEQIVARTASPSMVKGLLSELENRQNHTHNLVEEEDRIKWLTGTLFAAGADTSVASILVFVLAMILNPEVQSKARAEIEQVIGTDRLPEMDDRESLPYLGRVMREVMRWQSVLPLGFAHACTQEDEYRGYRIPKGATIIANVKAISNDESIYVKSEQFNPDRFLDSNVPHAPAFGFGRRSCPGIHMAESTLFIAMSSLLAVFDIRPAVDEQGKEAMPVVDMNPIILVSQPVEFNYLLKPRSEKAVHLLEGSVLSA